MSGSISSREVNRALRALVWPALREFGFTARTERTAWSYRPDCIAVVNVWSFNSYNAGVLGVTPLSFTANVGIGALCSSRDREYLVTKDGKLRPSEPDCDLRRRLLKTIAQPESAEQGIWFVRPDGTNLTATIEDMRTVLVTTGIAWLDEFSDLRRLLDYAENAPEELDTGNGTWGPGRPGSPNRVTFIHDLKQALQS